MNCSTPYDVAILGGGPAGLGVALALARRGDLSIVVVERSGYEDFRVGETIPPSACKILGELGLWREFLADDHLPSPGSCSAWGSTEPSYNDYLVHPWGNGWHLDRRRFDRTLARVTAERGVEILTSTSVRRSRSIGSGGFDLELVDERAQRFTLPARFVVDATGRQGLFSRSRGARQQVFDRLLGLYGLFRVRPGRTFDAFTLVESRPEGWWYSALLPDRRVVVALMTDAHSIRRGAAWQPTWEALLDLCPHTRERLEACTDGEPLRAVPANVYRASRVAGQDWLSVGDTASTFDPLSSQGILKALGSARPAAEAIRGALHGDRQALDRYTARTAQKFQEHLTVRQTYYAMETRWPNAPFWQRRAHPSQFDATEHTQIELARGDRHETPTPRPLSRLHPPHHGTRPARSGRLHGGPTG